MNMLFEVNYIIYRYLNNSLTKVHRLDKIKHSYSIKQIAYPIIII